MAAKKSPKPCAPCAQKRLARLGAMLGKARQASWDADARVENLIGAHWDIGTVKHAQAAAQEAAKAVQRLEARFADAKIKAADAERADRLAEVRASFKK